MGIRQCGLNESVDSRIDRPNGRLYESINSRIDRPYFPLIHKENKGSNEAFGCMFERNFKRMPFNNNNNNDNIMNNQGVESEEDKRSFTIKENNDASQNNEVNQNDQNNDSNNKQNKKINLNILYYDENLKLTIENKGICSYFEMNISGTFYGCHSLELFNNV